MSASEKKAAKSQTAFQIHPASDRGRLTFTLNTTKPA